MGTSKSCCCCKGVTAEAVVVSAADAAAIDTVRTVVGGTVTTKEIEELQIAIRLPLDLIFTLLRLN